MPTDAPALRRRRTRRALAVAAVALAPLALAFAGALPGIDQLASLLGSTAGSDPLSPPPTIALVTPSGAGAAAGEAVVVEGVASDDRAVHDVLVRVDGGAWRSASTVQRGAAAAPWAHVLEELAPGAHVVEARAFDGERHSLPVALEVKVGEARRPPAVAVTEPADGDGVEAGKDFLVSGTVLASRPVARVEVRLDGKPVGNATPPGKGLLATSWSLILPGRLIESGVHVLSVTAFDAEGNEDGTSLPRALRFAAADGGTAPAVRIFTPLPREGVSADAPNPACSGVAACVRVTGTLDDPSALATGLSVSVDEQPWRPVSSLGASALHRAGGAAAWSFEWPLEGAYAGEHVIRVRADSAAGVASVPAEVRVNVASPRVLELEATPASAAPTLTRVALLARWPSGALASNASWSVDRASADADGVGVLAVNFSRPGLHDVEAVAADADGRTARASLSLAALNRGPVPEFAPPAGVTTNATAIFRADASFDPDGDWLEHRWSFGDGTVTEWARSPEARHAFERRGAFDVTLSVRDAEGAVATSAPARVTVGNTPPQADFYFLPERAITVRSDVTFVDASVDLDGTPVARAWDFGDGTPLEGGSVVAHRFPTRGQFRVHLTVWDAAGESSTVTKDVIVENLPPTPRFSWTPEHPKAGEAVRFVDESRDLDGLLSSWQWRFGDDPDCAGAAALDGCGESSRAREPVYSYPEPGEYVVLLATADDAGAVASVTRVVRVGNAPPVVTASFGPESPTSFEDVAFTADVDDVEGRVARVEWDFGDGRRANGTSVLHHFVVPGLYNVTVTAWDDRGADTVVVLPVVVRNSPPIVAILSPKDVAYAGVPTNLTGQAVDRDGAVREVAWEVVGPFGTARYATAKAPHVFEHPGVYTITLMARDDAGEWSSVTRDLQVDVAPPGKYPPSILVEFPQPNATFKGPVRFTGTAHSAAPLARVEISFWRDGRIVTPFATPWARAEGLENWGFDFDSAALDNGAYDLVFRVVDGRGARGEARVPIVIGNVDYGELERVTLQVLNLNRSQVVDGKFVVRGTAFHPDGLSSVRVRVDDGPWEDVHGATADWAHAFDTVPLKNGPHTLEVRAYRTPALYKDVVVRFVADNPPPVLVVTKPMPLNASGIVTLEGRYAAGSPPADAYYRVDNGPWRRAHGNASWHADVDTRDLSDGNHTVSLMSVSKAGVEGPMVQYAFEASNIVPEDSLTRPGAQGATERAVPSASALGWVAAIVGAALFARRGRP